MIRFRGFDKSKDCKFLLQCGCFPIIYSFGMRVECHLWSHLFVPLIVRWNVSLAALLDSDGCFRVGSDLHRDHREICYK